MGRRGQTGAGGAVVSSLSKNSGGTVKKKSKGGKKAEDDERDLGFDFVFEGASSKRKPKKSEGSSASVSGSNASSSAPAGASAGWIGKSPLEFLREWCQKNNRKRPVIRPLRGPRGADGTMECFIPPGRRDGRPAKGSGFNAIAGIGLKPGEQYAALNVLHQVERARNLQQIIAPQFREVWLQMDKVFKETQEAQAKAAFHAERKKKQATRKAQQMKNAESATISVSTASRHAIEEALVGQGVAFSAAGASSSEPAPDPDRTDPVSVSNSSQSASTGISNEAAKRTEKQLRDMGFSRIDAECASLRFEKVHDAVDYLCLTLDEDELPKSFAPASDVEVVQFYNSDSAFGAVRVNVGEAQRLADIMSCSRLAAERALKQCDGDVLRGAGYLLSTLTSLQVESGLLISAEGSRLELAASERSSEAEALTAIYGDDVHLGVGSVKSFPESWGAELLVRGGIPGLGVSTDFMLCVVDLRGLYPLEPPILFVSPDSSGISRAHRRLAMRAVASHVSSLFKDAESDEPVHVSYSAVSFLGTSSEEELFQAASRRPQKEVAAAQVQVAVPDRPSATAHSKKKAAPGIRQPRQQSEVVQSNALRAMNTQRSRLPAWKARSDIIEAIRRNQVTVVSGATGSGKTTQVPQFLLEDAAATKEPVSIVCTQPRRIAAISIAERVAAERCEKVGQSVGYQVKLNVKRSVRTRLVFCTTGVLLRQMQSDAALESLTHVVIDEVHERSVETDFLLLLIRDILTERPSLRIILMSATLDASKFATYFGSGTDSAVPVISIPGRTFPVDQKYLEDAVSLANYRLRAGDRYAKKARGPVGRERDIGQVGGEEWKAALRVSATDVANAALGGTENSNELRESWESDEEAVVGLDGRTLGDSASQNSDIRLCLDKHGDAELAGRDVDDSQKETLKLIDESMVNLNLIDALVRRIDSTTNDNSVGAVLVFLPGIAEISQLVERLSRGPGSNKLFPVALHSALSPDDQSRVFNRPPNGKRKVICSTNIAETSVTVEDVQIVVDTCRVKEMSFDSLNGTSVLEEGFVSQAGSRQRAGRAGRVSKGVCYRLVKKLTFERKLAPQQVPEIRRVSLEHLVLNLLSIVPAGGAQRNPKAVLAKAMDPPAQEAVEAAVESLVGIGALERVEAASPGLKHSGSDHVVLTSLGRHLTGLPVDARIGKLLVYGSLFACVDPVLTVAATLSERSPFFSPRDKRQEAADVRKAKFGWGKSDLLTYVRAFNAWNDIRKSGCGYREELEFCDSHFLSRKTLLAIRDVRSHLQRALSDAGFGDDSSSVSSMNENQANTRVISAVICAALYPNVIRVDHPPRKYDSIAGGSVAKSWSSKELKLRARSGERVFLHPESINFSEGDYGSRWLAYFNKVKTTRVYVRDATMVSPYAILLFGGEIEVRHDREQLAVDKWVVFKSPPRTAVLVRELRRNLDGLLQRKFESPWMNLFEDAQALAVSEAILRLIKLES